MTSSSRRLPQGFRSAPPGLLSPAQLLEAAGTLSCYTTAADARGEPILETKLERGRTRCAREAAGGGARTKVPCCIYKFRLRRDATGVHVGELVNDWSWVIALRAKVVDRDGSRV